MSGHAGLHAIRAKAAELSSHQYGWGGQGCLPVREDALDFVKLWACRALSHVPSELVTFRLLSDGTISILVSPDRVADPTQAQSVLQIIVRCWGVADISEHYVDEYGPSQVVRTIRLKDTPRDSVHAVENWVSIADLTASVNRVLASEK